MDLGLKEESAPTPYFSVVKEDDGFHRKTNEQNSGRKRSKYLLMKNAAMNKFDKLPKANSMKKIKARNAKAKRSQRLRKKN